MPFWSCACTLSSFLYVFHFMFHVSGRAVIFCTNCGKSCVSNAKYCHTCGKHLSESIAKEESTQNEKGQSSGGRRCRSNRSDFRADVLCSIESTQCKQEDRTKHFTKKSGKRLKLETKGKPSSKVSTWKIQIGIMIKKDGSLRVKRGNNTTLPLTAAADISYNELLAKAVEKQDRFDEDVIKNKEKEFYCLLYSDKTKAEFLPGSDERFNLHRCKEAPVYTTNVLGTAC